MSDIIPDKSEHTPHSGEEGSTYNADERAFGTKQTPSERGGIGKPGENEADTFLSFLKELPALIITAVAIAFVIKWLILQPFYIHGQSMEPTLVTEDRVLISKFIYRFVEPKAGDIVVLVPPSGDNRDFIKRIVAVEGEVVEVKEGEVFINGNPAPQDFETMPGDYSNWGPEEIRTDNVFVMGDNRPNSLDGRVFGQLPEENILGKAFIVYWPAQRIRLLN